MAGIEMEARIGEARGSILTGKVFAKKTSFIDIILPTGSISVIVRPMPVLYTCLVARKSQIEQFGS